jgi:hypothetical protein
VKNSNNLTVQALSNGPLLDMSYTETIGLLYLHGACGENTFVRNNYCKGTGCGHKGVVYSNVGTACNLLQMVVLLRLQILSLLFALAYHRLPMSSRVNTWLPPHAGQRGAALARRLLNCKVRRSAIERELPGSASNG